MSTPEQLLILFESRESLVLMEVLPYLIQYFIDTATDCYMSASYIRRWTKKARMNMQILLPQLLAGSGRDRRQSLKVTTLGVKVKIMGWPG